MQMQPMMAAYYPNNVTTDHIQQYLDENKSLILKIVESQNCGKLSECAENQAKLQRNLMYLAAIADSQPQPPSLHPQFPSSTIAQPGSYYVQHQQAQPMNPQSLMAARSSMLYTQQQPYSSLHGQPSMSSGASSGLNLLQSESSHSGGNGALGGGGFPEGLQVGGRGMAGGNKHDLGSSSSGEGRGSGLGSGGQGGADGGETLYLKSADGSN